MRLIHVLLILLCCLPVAAVDVGSDVIFNTTNVSITTGAAHSWTSLSVHSNHIEMGSDEFAANPANPITIWNWIWGDEITYNASCDSGDVRFNITNNLWNNKDINIYINNSLDQTVTASSGTINYLYGGGWSEKEFKFIPLETPTEPSDNSFQGIINIISSAADIFNALIGFVCAAFPVIIAVTMLSGLFLLITSIFTRIKK